MESQEKAQPVQIDMLLALHGRTHMQLVLAQEDLNRSNQRLLTANAEIERLRNAVAHLEKRLKDFEEIGQETDGKAAQVSR